VLIHFFLFFHGSFHIMSVGVVEYNDKVVTDDGYAFYRTETVADDLRNYIANFFGCEVCRMNFLQAYDTCAFDRCNRLHNEVGDLAAWKQFPLYLFEVHNAVNVRLMKEQAERDNRQPTHQDEIKAQWPYRLDCPKCWNSDGSWDEEIIYKYLFDQYWPDDAGMSEASRRALFHPTIIVEPEDVDDEGSFLISLLKFGPILALVLTMGYLYRRRSYINKTGRHKRAY
jgi:Erv1 / Alr family